MIFGDFIDELHKKDIKISFSDGKLIYSGPEENITRDLREKLIKFKGKLIKRFWPEEFSNIIPISPEGSKTPLFIVHGDYGNYLISSYLGQDQPVYCFFHPGSRGEAIKFESVNTFAKAYLEKLLKICPQGPYYLAGFSFGGILAFEMAVQLKKMGNDVPFLAIIDSLSPLAIEPVAWHNTPYRVIRSNILHPLKMGIKKTINVLFCESYILINRPIPLKKRSFYLLNKYRILTKKFRPDKFNGDLLLFKAIKDKSSFEYLGWETLANSIKLIYLEADHITIFKNKKSVEILLVEFGKYFSQIKAEKV